MELINQVLKQDVAGRVWTPRAQREAALDEFERSGLPGTKFAAQIGVKYQTFVSWCQKRRKERMASGNVGEVPKAVRPLGGWLEAIAGPTAPAALTVQLPGGARIEISDGRQAALAAELLRALRVSGGALAC